ncbi:MAG: hypothetical protein EP338_06260 [Bacteroidetes bacterium]|nr:MAG: hypothetical protein EP338_06260 [Bacteroidota bacterium]
MKSFFRSFFKGKTNRLKDSHLPTLLVVSPVSGMDQHFEKLTPFLPGVNMVILNEFDLGEQLLDKLAKQEKQELFVLAYGSSAPIALDLTRSIELRRQETALILLDGSFEKDLQDEFPAIESDVYFFQSIGGSERIALPQAILTKGKITSFPLHGHHHELLKDYLLDDLGFFISNIVRKRSNLLIYTLSTQAAAPNWYMDQEHRPFGEGKAPEECKKEVPFDYKTCPYPGSRKKHEKPMNVSALKQMREHWSESMNLIRKIRDLYLPNHPVQTPELIDVWKMTLYASYLPAYLIYREKSPLLNHCIPPVVSAVYKMFIGLKAPIEHMTRDLFLGALESPQISSKIIHDYAEKRGSFIGPEEVCGGPENLVIEFLDAFMLQETAYQSNPLISRLLPDEGEYMRFVKSIINLQILNFIHLQQVQYVVKHYIRFSENETLIRELEENYAIGEDSVAPEKHLQLIGHLFGWLENSEKFELFPLKEFSLNSIEDVEKLNEEIESSFYRNVEKLEQEVRNLCGFECSSISVNESIYPQYRGKVPFSYFYKKYK